MLTTRAVVGWASGWPQAEAPRRAKGAAGVSLSEYDFSGVSEGELRSCLHYEYARESAEIARLVEGLREKLRKQVETAGLKVDDTFSVPLSFTNFTRRGLPMHDAWYLMTLSGRKEFPRVPWQDLKAEDRELLLGFPGNAAKMHDAELRRKAPAFICGTGPYGDGLLQVTLEAWQTKSAPEAYRDAPEELRRKYLRSGFFIVNLEYTPDQILDGFKRWLVKQHPGAKNPPPEKRGRKSERDRLNALGAMRLRFYCRTLSEAQGLAAPLRKKENGMSYSDRTAWNRACTRAVDYFRQVLDLRENGLPIHYSKGWQK